MISHEIEYLRCIAVTVILTTLLAALTWEVLGLAWAVLGVDPSNITWKVTSISTAISVFWIAYDRHLWKINFFRVGGWLCSTPNLNGRWVGVINRENEDFPHGFVMEIHQTMTKINFNTYSQNSRGKSIAVKFLKNDTHSVFQIVSYWSSRTKIPESVQETEEFCGLSVSDIHIDKETKRLDTHYFTERKPPTRGKLSLNWHCDKTYGKFDEKAIQN